MAFSLFSSMSNLIRNVPSNKTASGLGLNVISNTSLVYYYDFEESSLSSSLLKLKNCVTSNEDGNLVGTTIPSIITAKHGDSALECYENTKYMTVTSSNIGAKANQSMAFWFYCSSCSSQSMVFQGNTGSQTILVIQNISGSYKLVFVVNKDISQLGTTLTSTMTLNTWHHIVVIKNGNSISIYYDGSLVTTNTNVVNATKYIIYDDTVMYFGRASADNTSLFYGAIDSFYIYNRSITSTEALALYNSSI
jgi:hypothetical protein